MAVQLVPRRELESEYPALAANGVTNTGTGNYGPVVTANGLLFIGATTYDKEPAQVEPEVVAEGREGLFHPRLPGGRGGRR